MPQRGEGQIILGGNVRGRFNFKSLTIDNKRNCNKCI